MKILCINTNGLNNDGITNSILNYYSHMDKRDMIIHVLKTRETKESIEQSFINIGIELKFTDYRTNFLSYLFKTTKLIRKEKYDIVHVHGSSALMSLDLLAAKIAGCKVRIAHSRNTSCKHKHLDKLLRPLFYTLCNVRFACGEDAGKWLFQDRPFTVIKNGKDLDVFLFNPEMREIVRENYNWNGKTIIGHVGTFNYQKNHEFLVRVFSSLEILSPDYLLVLIGSGKGYNIIQDQVHDEKIDNKVFFMGSIDNISDILQGLDIMLLPSLSEGLPNVVLEWQAVGLPSIISDKVTKECAVCDLVEFLPIDKGVEPWVNAIQSTGEVDRLEQSKKAQKALSENGYNIEQDARILKEIYLSLTNECK